MADLSSSAALEQLTQDFYPVLPVVMYGRPARLGTEAPSETCVWYGWRDLRALMYRATSQPISSIIVLF